MNLKRIYLICTVCGFLFFLLYACIPDEWIVDSGHELPMKLEFGKNSELTITAAKSWYGTHKKPVSRMVTNVHNKWGFLVSPSWNHAKEWRKGRYEVVEVSLRSNVDVIFMDKETNSKKEQMSNEEKKKIMNVGRCVILKDVISGEIRTFNMVVIGSYKYLMKDKNNLSDNNYLYRKPDFDGKVLYFNTEGEFVNGWIYKNGKIVKILSPTQEIVETSSTDPNLAKSRGYSECHTEYYYYTYYYCPQSRSTFMDDWMGIYGEGEFGGKLDENGDVDGGELGDVTVVAPYCSWITVEVPYQECDYDGDNNGDYIPGIDPTPVTCPKAKKIIKKTEKLTKEQLEKLETVIVKMIEKVCYAEAIYNYLITNELNYNEVIIDPTLGGGNASAANGYLSNGEVNLKFREDDCIEYSGFLHEMVHLFQYKLDQYKGQDSRGMMEYERNLIDDILFYKQYRDKKGDFSKDIFSEKPSSWIFGSYSGKSESTEYYNNVERYKKWLNRITENGIPSSISIEDFNRWIPLFSENSRAYSSDYGYKYNISYSPTALQKVLELATVNCK